MKAGRELDILVAEKVFGQTRNWEGVWELLPFYSTDIAAAWEVIRAMQPKRSIRIYGGGGRGDRAWLCEINEGRGDYCEAWAATAPLAICLAALEISKVK